MGIDNRKSAVILPPIPKAERRGYSVKSGRGTLAHGRQNGNREHVRNRSIIISDMDRRDFLYKSLLLMPAARAASAQSFRSEESYGADLEQGFSSGIHGSIDNRGYLARPQSIWLDRAAK